jgi:hypothetical protein
MQLPTNTGYDVTATRKVFHGGRKNPPRPNGYLDFHGTKCYLWVDQLMADFAMNIQRAQSYRTRTAFPRNFVQPSFTVRCQCANQRIYADTVEFIRTTQTHLESATTLTVVNVATYKGHRKLRGRHRGNSAEGYVRAVRREYGRFINAPTLSFDFVVERHLSPSGWDDGENLSPKVLPTWKEVIEQGKRGFALDPDPPVPAADDGGTLDRPPLAPGPNGENRPN